MKGEEKEPNEALTVIESIDGEAVLIAQPVNKGLSETEIDIKTGELIISAETQSVNDYAKAKEICEDFQLLLREGDTAANTKMAVNEAMDNMTKATGNLINLANILARMKLGDAKVQIANIQGNSSQSKELIKEIENIMNNKLK